MIPDKTSALLLGFAALTLTSCAIDRAPTLSAAKPFAGQTDQVELVSEKNETGLRQDFAVAVTQAFSQHSVDVAKGSNLVADFAISAASDNVGLDPVTQDPPRQAAGSPDRVQTRWYHRCPPERVTASLAIFDRRTNQIVAKSKGFYIACPGDRQQLDNLADLLVKSAVTEGRDAPQE